MWRKQWSLLGGQQGENWFSLTLTKGAYPLLWWGRKYEIWKSIYIHEYFVCIISLGVKINLYFFRLYHLYPKLIILPIRTLNFHKWINLDLFWVKINLFFLTYLRRICVNFFAWGKNNFISVILSWTKKKLREDIYQSLLEGLNWFTYDIRYIKYEPYCNIKGKFSLLVS